MPDHPGFAGAAKACGRQSWPYAESCPSGCSPGSPCAINLASRRFVGLYP